MKQECPGNYPAVISLDNYKTHCSPLERSVALKGICLLVKWKATTENISTVTKKLFIWERHRDVTSIPLKGSGEGRSYDGCLRATLRKHKESSVSREVPSDASIKYISPKWANKNVHQEIPGWVCDTSWWFLLGGTCWCIRPVIRHLNVLLPLTNQYWGCSPPLITPSSFQFSRRRTVQ